MNMIFIFARRRSSPSQIKGPELLIAKLSRLNLFLAMSLAVILACPSVALAQNPPNISPPSAPDHIRWNPEPGVQRYRLQISTDNKFNDVMFDKVVTGREYIPRNLAPGRYYWRVGPTNSKRFLRIGQLVVTKEAAYGGGVYRVPVPGWVATTGDVSAPIAAQLRSDRDPDFLVTNAAGTVYALDSARGITLWTAHYAFTATPAASQPRRFAPIVANRGDNTTLVIVAFEKGLRALDGLSGKEAWQVELPAGIVGGLAANLDDQPGSEVYLTEDSTNQLILLNGQNGQIKLAIKLNASPLGPPVALTTKNFRGIVTPLGNNALEVRDVDGKYVLTIRLGVELTTAPITAETSTGVVLMVGTEIGLMMFDTDRFEALRRASIEVGHYPLGPLAVLDLDGDKHSDRIVLITNLGRIAAVNPSDGKIVWFADGFKPSGSLAFGDLDRDGWLDVVVPDSKNFAVGLSGKNGSRLWESSGPEGIAVSTNSETTARKLATVTRKDGRIMVVGNDPSAPGLRALELRTGLTTHRKS